MQVMLEAATKFLKTGKKMLLAALDLLGRKARSPLCSAICNSAIRTCRWAAYPFQRDGKPGTQLVLR